MENEQSIEMQELMNKYNKRMEYLEKARELFVKTGITKNITEALSMYNDTLTGDQRIPVMVPASQLRHPMSIMIDRHYIRPQCSECKAELTFRPYSIAFKDVIYKTSWMCPKCKREIFSDKTVDEWFSILGKKQVRMEDKYALGW